MYYIGFFKDSPKMLVFKDERVPTLSRYGYFDKVMGPFNTLVDANYIARDLRRRGNPYHSKAKYCRERQQSPSKFDKRSFRTIALGKSGQKGVIACPKGEWNASRKKCRVGTKLESILYPVGQGGCKEGGTELPKRKHRHGRRNPYTRTGLYYPKRGSEEAYEWAQRMQEAKSKKRYRRNPPKKYLSDKKAMMLTKKIMSMAKQLFKHERSELENPGQEYHKRMFAKYAGQLEHLPIGSRTYLVVLGKMYDQLESAGASVGVAI